MLSKDPNEYFRRFHIPGEIRIERSAAKKVCELATERWIWILGVDVGYVFDDGRYLEDFNEGWLSNFGLMSERISKNFEKGIVRKEDLFENNKYASLAIINTEDHFNAFTITGKEIKLVTE